MAVVGLGKLGLPLATLLAEAGHQVTGCDLDISTVETLSAGGCPIVEPGVEEMLRRYGGGMVFTNLVETAAETDMSFIVVPTPSGRDGAFESDYVVQAVEALGVGLRRHDRRHVVVVVSTVMPGETEGRILSALERASGREVGPDLGLCYSPEFIALGSVLADMRRPDLVLIGCIDQRSGQELDAVLRSIDSGIRRQSMPCDEDLPGGAIHTFASRSEAHIMLSLTEAEIAKIGVNAYVTMKISFANTLGEIAEHYGCQGEAIARAIGADSRIGPKYLRPGRAFGGPCFPRDNAAFMIAAAQRGVRAPLAKATDLVNEHQIPRFTTIVQSHTRHGDRVAILGIAYKPGTNVTERSFGLELARRLSGMFDVVVYDPLAKPTFEQAAGISVEESVDKAIDGAATVVLANDDPAFLCSYPGAVVIDCWGMPIPLDEVAEYVRVGGRAPAR